jgi:hypothetical protein
MVLPRFANCFSRSLPNLESYPQAFPFFARPIFVSENDATHWATGLNAVLGRLGSFQMSIKSSKHQC